MSSSLSFTVYVKPTVSTLVNLTEFESFTFAPFKLTIGGDYDYERAAAVILDEFRGGKLGKVSFEEP